MSDYTFTEQELAELKEVFFTEAYEILEFLNQEVLNLETGIDRASALKAIQRHLHTLKGNSRALSFACINTLSHKAEDLLKKIQDVSLDIDQGLIDLLFNINDALKFYLDGYRTNQRVDLDKRLIERIEGYLAVSGNGSNPPAPQQAEQVGQSSSVYDITVIFDQKCDMKAAGANLILERLSAIGEILSVEPATGSPEFETSDRCRIGFGSSETIGAIKGQIDVPGITHSVEIKRREAGHAPQQAPEQKSYIRDDAAQMLRVEAQRVDKILNLVGELVIARSMVSQALAEIEERYKKNGVVKRLDDANALMEKTLSQLQKNVMKIRMLPISQVFRKFPRVVRDLAMEKGKQVRLVMEGEKTELDKSILDVIGEPLIHLVRNAVDHGIEPPEEREKAGKQKTGTITLRADYEGNQIVIEVEDDGAGLDPGRLRKKAVERGFKTQEEAERMSDEDALGLIFLSGFSTADVVTDISGRGFGMDIVRTTIESLRGRIQVRSRPENGTTFTLRLPLTLAIIRAMLFTVADRLFAIPMTSIEKILRIREKELETVNGKTVLRFRDRVISLINLSEAFMPAGGNVSMNTGRRRFVIVVGLGEKLYGLLVDGLVGQQELVIKALDNHWVTVNCASGASILGNGKVVLILDAPALIAREMRREAMKTQGHRA